MKTVIVRLFEPAPGAGPAPLTGVVEDVTGRHREPFVGVAGLVAALLRAAERAAGGRP